MGIPSHSKNSKRVPLHNKEQIWHILYAIASVFKLNSLMFSLECLIVSIPSASPSFEWFFVCFVTFCCWGLFIFLIIIIIVYRGKATEREMEAAL